MMEETKHSNGLVWSFALVSVPLKRRKKAFGKKVEREKEERE